MMLERIRREHGYMVRLLAILNRKLQRLEQEETINYGLVKEIVDYLANHSDKVHHPKEDILYHYYIQHYGSRQEIANLEFEHEQLSEKSHDFLNVVEMILHDAVVPKELFADQLAEFIRDQKRHLDNEEQQVLPLIEQTFTTRDWQQVGAQWSESASDPVFGETIADRYRQLAERVRQNDLESV
ncbi:hemerythrin domain-containing protein [Vibrio hippocampi]|uniref:Hemerythrin-like domain-containing protein n=1 Tax=Vibrio hippocampi TaxID=654686 RepID=A0ABN8DJ53_9VIBR|nr:hemerythrin domain-containing protein [Vibrio hippocampi]CAH0526815.1 hypothetical protein VHP8226_02191 [Vibrio hippocampi]